MRVTMKTDLKPPVEQTPEVYEKLLREIQKDIALADRALMRIGSNLKRIYEEKLYLCGGYQTFTLFCQYELGKSRQHIYRLMDAYELCRRFLLGGMEENELPMNERICRALNRLSPPEQTPVWNLALKMVHKRSKAADRKDPTLRDVQNAELQLLGKESRIIEQQEEVIKKLDRAARTLHMNLNYEALSPEFKTQLIVRLTQIGSLIALQLKALNALSKTQTTHTIS
jgi:hypothetical protein